LASTLPGSGLRSIKSYFAAGACFSALLNLLTTRWNANLIRRRKAAYYCSKPLPVKENLQPLFASYPVERRIESK
jgi:hypothetical protein